MQVELVTQTITTIDQLIHLSPPAPNMPETLRFAASDRFQKAAPVLSLKRAWVGGQRVTVGERWEGAQTPPTVPPLSVCSCGLRGWCPLRDYARATCGPRPGAAPATQPPGAERAGGAPGQERRAHTAQTPSISPVLARSCASVCTR